MIRTQEKEASEEYVLSTSQVKIESSDFVVQIHKQEMHYRPK